MSDVMDVDLGWKRIKKDLAKLNKFECAVGLFGVGGDPEENMAYLGSIHEFGSKDGNVPMRSFERSTFDEKEKRWVALSAIMLKKLIEGHTTVNKVYETLGTLVRSDIQTKIESNVPPPLKPSTVSKKGSSRTLIDTGRMKNSVEYIVRAGKR